MSWVYWRKSVRFKLSYFIGHVNSNGRMDRLSIFAELKFDKESRIRGFEVALSVLFTTCDILSWRGAGGCRSCNVAEEAPGDELPVSSLRGDNRNVYCQLMSLQITCCSDQTCARFCPPLPQLRPHLRVPQGGAAGTLRRP